MCIGIPMQVEKVEGLRAWCAGRDGHAWVDVMLVGPVSRGDWLLTFLGAAREILDAERAQSIGDALQALDAVLAGDPSAGASVDAAFADLIGREPQLPPHLRPQR
ncbi:HypC/HybG/HupF family hydrogenase formation chaperone [Sinimarinibacterium sp. CAU 1509]|uniref:HypC/HybG/HupF family hydrogenase formation chaperone n=1 Tax=Sinimarinibacterium sp. CAU 1509 TaxID=2562283 RepID=UPI0010ABDCD6|nr:HypC/HybG/HupF family hydrogenase formation chaperone [Sinimarinibacterium sp. CAU 1509]TJY60045.1 HypC/HybG/HupF family hydrogenase formation chaperone [Sinimarinibacterium sp. CAU 1509]